MPFQRRQKENVIARDPVTNEKSMEQVMNGKQVVSGDKGPSGPKGNFKDRRAGFARVNGQVGPKVAGPKKHLPTKPMRGLVFGPTGSNIVLSESGKRLRTEKENVGQRGGIFTNKMEETGGVESMVPNGAVGTMILHPEVRTEERLVDEDQVVQMESPEVANNLVA